MPRSRASERVGCRLPRSFVGRRPGAQGEAPASWKGAVLAHRLARALAAGLDESRQRGAEPNQVEPRCCFEAEAGVSAAQRLTPEWDEDQASASAIGSRLTPASVKGSSAAVAKRVCRSPRPGCLGRDTKGLRPRRPAPWSRLGPGGRARLDREPARGPWPGLRCWKRECRVLSNSELHCLSPALLLLPRSSGTRGWRDRTRRAARFAHWRRAAHVIGAAMQGRPAVFKARGRRSARHAAGTKCRIVAYNRLCGWICQCSVPPSASATASPSVSYSDEDFVRCISSRHAVPRSPLVGFTG
jgi:hypothetical protein